MKNIESYIEDIKIEDNDKNKIVVEHRSNNSKRDYLFVNLKQGKHIPCKPSQSIEMFTRLSKKIDDCTYGYKNILVVGFAETATAIGNFVCNNISNCVYYMQTTREQVKNCDIIVEFEEKHSHAVEQMIYSSKDISKMNIDCVVFVEDEISTGKTILNCIEKLQKSLGDNVKYCVASICNWQNDEYTAVFDEKGISRVYLIGGKLKDEHIKMAVDIDRDINKYEYKYSGKKYNINKICVNTGQFKREREGYVPYDTGNLARMIASIPSNILHNSFKNPKDAKVLVLGTEEFMYIPMMVAYSLECEGYNVCNHANSRSSIDVINGSTAGIMNKTELPSVYDSNRNTYIYNLKYYDKVFIVTDTNNVDEFGNLLADRLSEFGVDSDNICFIIVEKN